MRDHDHQNDFESTFAIPRSTAEQSVFQEYAMAFEKIDVLVQQHAPISDMNKALNDLRSIFDKYLELPYLLDKHLESMVNTLAMSARSNMDSSSMISVDAFWSSSLPRLLSSLYALAKVRGRKRIQKFLPHRVEDVQPVFHALRCIHEISKTQGKASLESSAAGEPQLWESIYVLWNWVGILSLVPFQSSVVIDSESIDRLVDMAKEYLCDPGPTREMAAAALAMWLSRPDLEHSHLKDFQNWADQQLRHHLERDSHDTMRTMGILQTLVTVFKISTSDRNTLLRIVTPLQPTMERIAEAKPGNLLLRKYLMKWWTRTAVLHMPPRVAAWRYKRGRRSLKENLTRASQICPEKSTSIENHEPKTPQEYELFLVPDQVEDALGEVILGLTDSSTVVRWSAAKGVGRIIERLPALCSDDALHAILDLFSDREKDNDWQGACLAMAELARRGLLLPHRLSEVVDKVIEAIHYDVPRRQTSVGAHVRDAACYTFWAIARAYSPEVVRPYSEALCKAVVVAFLFDREVNCRRAASAAFQEFVGRQGGTNVRNGIAILTKADFFSLGNRAVSYLSIAIDIAQFGEYHDEIIDALYKVKLQHWDPNIRLLSAQALGKLAALNPVRMTSNVIPYLLTHSLDQRKINLRHGSVIGLAEITLAFGELKSGAGSFHDCLNVWILKDISELVPTIEKKRLYRGKGGEQMRAAVCRLIECLCIAGVPLTVPQQVRLLDTVDACIPHPNEGISDQATLALSQLMRNYFPVSASGPSDRLQKRVVDKYVKEVKTSVNPAATRGFSMALGRLPSKLLAPSSEVLDMSLTCLCKISRPDATVGNEKDAETRRNAIISLGRICSTVGMAPDKGSECVVGLSPKQVGHVFTALFRGLSDYNMERRGDVGSMSRIAAMQGLVSLTTTINCSPAFADTVFTEDICRKMVGGLLKQLCEKLDAVRSEAGRCLSEMLGQSNPKIPNIPDEEKLRQCLQSGTAEVPIANINWADASTAFPIAVKCLELEPYFQYVVSGLVISVGSLTQSVAQEAGSALIFWVKNATGESIDRLGEAFIEIFRKHHHEGRVVLPLLKTIRMLFNRLCIERLIRSSTFSRSLIEHLVREEETCTDVHRLTCIIEVSLKLLGAENDCQKEVLAFACKLLMHSYPRVRRIAAENLYVKLTEMCVEGESPLSLDLLLTTPWDSMDEESISKAADDITRFLAAVESTNKTEDEPK